MSVTNEVRNSVKQSLQYSDVKALNLTTLPKRLFVQIFNQHCIANNLGKPKFNQDFYAGPFSARDIEVREEVVTYKGRTYPRQPVVFGLDVIEEGFGFTKDF